MRRCRKRRGRGVRGSSGRVESGQLMSMHRSRKWRWLTPWCLTDFAFDWASAVGQTSALTAGSGVRLQCGPGYYGLIGESCSLCPEGASCAGNVPLRCTRAGLLLLCAIEECKHTRTTGSWYGCLFFFAPVQAPPRCPSRSLATFLCPAHPSLAAVRRKRASVGPMGLALTCTRALAAAPAPSARTCKAVLYVASHKRLLACVHRRSFVVVHSEVLTCACASTALVAAPGLEVVARRVPTPRGFCSSCSPSDSSRLLRARCI